MLPLERRDAWLVQADGRAAEALAALLPRVPLRVLSPALVAERRHRLGNGPLVVTGQALDDPHTADKLTELALAGVRLLRLRDYYERKLRRVMLDDLDDTWFLFDRPLRRRPVYSAVKAAVDLLAGLVGSLLAVLIAPLIWLVYRFEDGGPLFYRQERIGLGGRPFGMWKFRTMQVDAECNGPVWASVNDQRVTRLGRLLRSTHLDELPQFFNVLRREMSLIGPRPERPAFVRLLSRAIPYFDRRHLVRPGVTGWAVIRFGYSDSVRDKWIIHEYDLYYLKHRSLLLDLEITVRTVLVMLTRKGQ
ncbi:MAG TPA: sugar transferase [Actinomycetota bacterium]|jgi:lipopolysaccharide/colanic/teichoic acid biosynthesis glycosyltransferase|nr:sugar transferase [Actinomycetota bacterium]